MEQLAYVHYEVLDRVDKGTVKHYHEAVRVSQTDTHSELGGERLGVRLGEEVHCGLKLNA